MINVSDNLKITTAVEYLKARLNDPVARVAIVLGSGLGYFAEQISVIDSIDNHEIPYYPPSTVIGHAGKFVNGRIGGTPLITIQGRTHLYEGRSLEEITFYVEILARLGVRYLILTNAAGGIDASLSPGNFVLLKDYISFTQIALEDSDKPKAHSPFSPELINMARQIAQQNKINLHDGIYCWTLGPSYETPAEIRAARKMGATVVGMSTVPEAILARKLGMEVLGISLVTNFAAGILDTPITHEEVQIAAESSKKPYSYLMEQIVNRLGNNPNL
jgi:purine-nucleoside phosphorylase